MEPQLPKRCTFKICKQGLVGKDINSLNKQQREHIRNVHEPWTCYIAVNVSPSQDSQQIGVFFTFRRITEKCHCFCETGFTSPRSLKAHVTGSNSDPPCPCPFVTRKAKEVASTGEVFENAKAEINYWPINNVSKGSDQGVP